MEEKGKTKEELLNELAEAHRRIAELEASKSERKKVEETLKLFLQATETSVDGIAMGNLEGRITYANEAFVKMFGYSKEELIGKEIASIHPEYQKPILTKALEATLKSGWIGELVGQRKNGELFPVAISTSRVTDDEGKVIADMAVHRDITERKRAEEVLREREERLRVALTSAEMGTWHLIPATNQDTRDASINRILGLEAVESTQPLEDFLQRVHPDDRASVEAKIQRALRERNVYLTEFRIIRPDGTICWLRCQGKGFYDERGKGSYITGAVVDITKSKRVEENLKEAITIINRSPVVTFTWRNETGWPVEFVSENVTKLFGYTSEEWTSAKVSYIDIIYPDDRERMVGEVARYSKENGREEFAHEPYRIIAKDGSVHWVHDWTFITRDEKGSITHYKGILQDITERKQAEEARQDSEARLNEAQAIARIGNWSQDLRTTETLWSKENYRIFGLSHETLISQEEFEKTIHPEDREFVNKSQEDAIKRKKPLDVEFRIILPGGKERIVRSIAKTDYDNEGQPIKVFGINQDITERKKAEEALRERTDRLERFYKVTIDRELDMIKLKEEINFLLEKLGQPGKYKVPEKARKSE